MVRTDFTYKRLGPIRIMINNHPDTGSDHPTYGPRMLAYLHSQQLLGPVIPRDVGLSSAVWTRFGHRHPPPRRIWPGGWAMGGCPRVSVCVGTSQNYVKN